MSVTGTPLRTPLREIAANLSTPKNNAPANPHKHRTPKTSPGPALLLAITLSAKKELLKNHGLGLLEEKENHGEQNETESNSVVSGVSFFRAKLSSETARITSLCNKWDELLTKTQSADENDGTKMTDAIMGDVRTTVGQGRLIMRERFHQFKGLVDNCEFGTSEKPVTCEDLQGFWEMIYFQVEDVDGKFELLEKCKIAGWDAGILSQSTNGGATKKKIDKKKKPKPLASSSALSKARREKMAEKRVEARKRLAAAKAEMKRLKESEESKENQPVIMPIKDQKVTFDAGFFKIESPIKSPLVKAHTPSTSNGTPRGTCLRKQVCTPGSITKSLAAVAAVSSETKNTDQINTKKETAEIKTDVSKKLEFAAAIPQESCLDTNDCLVEVLLTDPLPLTPRHEAHTSTPLAADVVKVMAPLEDFSLDSGNEKDSAPEQKNALGTHENSETNTNFPTDYDPDKLLVVEISQPVAISPPAAFADIGSCATSTKAAECDEDNLESNKSTCVDNHQFSTKNTSAKNIGNSEVVTGDDKCVTSTKDAGCGEDNLESNKSTCVDNHQFSTENTPTKNIGNSDVATRENVSYAKVMNETYDVSQHSVGSDVVGVCGKLEETPQASMKTLNVMYELPILDTKEEKVSCSKDVATPKGATENDQKIHFKNTPKSACSFKNIILDETVDMDASEISILVDEATKNVEKVSEILKETPRRKVSAARSTKTPSVKPVTKKLTDAGTSITPSVSKDDGKERDNNVLLETLRIVTAQLVGIQKINNSILNTPQRTANGATMKMQNDIEMLQSKIKSLMAENLDLRKTLEEKDDFSTDGEKVMKVLYEMSDEVMAEPDIGYKPHYFRLLTKVKILEAELRTFDQAKMHLPELNAQITEIWTKLDKRTCEVKECAQELMKREAELNEMEAIEKEELAESRKTVQELKLQLSSVQENFDASEKQRLECCTALESLQTEYDSVKKQNLSLEEEISKLKEENFVLDEKNVVLEEKVDATSKVYQEQHSRAEALENKVNYLGDEIESAFAEFSSNIQQRDDILKTQQAQIEELTSANTKLCQDCKVLQDRIETLEYVEDEMTSLQEQLAETESALKVSEEREADKDGTIQELNVEILSLNQVIENNKVRYANLQEELDVAKSEAHFMLQQREEELIYGKTGLDHLLNMMKDLDMTIRAKIAEEKGEELAKSATIVPSPENHHGCENHQSASRYVDLEKSPSLPDTSLSSSSQGKKESSPAKTSDTIIWRVDSGVEQFQTIIKSCGDLQTQFQKEFDAMDFQNSVLRKQLVAMKDKLSNFNKEESELEQVLRKRVEKLIRESELKSTKLEDNARTMRMLADQNVELTKYKMKYEEFADDLKNTRRCRSTKRRSSSVGALKFFA